MSIADKLLTIANNTPEVCSILAPPKTVSGSVISVGDVSPIEHSLDVRLKSKNLFTNELITDSYSSTIEKTDANSCIITAKGTNPCYQGFCVEVPKSEKFTLSLNCLVENTPTNTSGAVNAVQIWKRKTTDKGHSPNVSVTRFITGASNGIQKNVSITLLASDFEGYPYMQISWYRNIQSLSETPENPYKATLTNIQLEEGSTATAFTPYIADFSGVIVGRYGEHYAEPQTATANADGIVNGLTSVSPNMTLISDTDSVVIECTYHSSDSPEANEKYTELQDAFANAKEIIKEYL